MSTEIIFMGLPPCSSFRALRCCPSIVYLNNATQAMSLSSTPPTCARSVAQWQRAHSTSVRGHADLLTSLTNLRASPAATNQDSVVWYFDPPRLDGGPVTHATCARSEAQCQRAHSTRARGQDDLLTSLTNLRASPAATNQDSAVESVDSS